jgi:hypothetical protein
MGEVNLQWWPGESSWPPLWELGRKGPPGRANRVVVAGRLKSDSLELSNTCNYPIPARHRPSAPATKDVNQATP